jgi:hypothetical protein
MEVINLTPFEQIFRGGKWITTKLRTGIATDSMSIFVDIERPQIKTEEAMIYLENFIRAIGLIDCGITFQYYNSEISYDVTWSYRAEDNKIVIKSQSMTVVLDYAENISVIKSFFTEILCDADKVFVPYIVF